MEQKEHLLSKIITGSFLFSSLLLCLSCVVDKEDKSKERLPVYEKVSTEQIPLYTISSVDSNLNLVNGIYFLNEVPFSGIIKEVYENGGAKSIGSYFLGMQEGLTKTFYASGKGRDIRSYKENVGYGRHVGYWENGNMKFDFTYYFDKREGLQKQWYESGSPYAFLTFKDDREEGMQQAWRENGKPYINYVAKDGFRYGLQKSSLCYSLKDEKIKSTVLPNEEIALKK